MQYICFKAEMLVFSPSLSTIKKVEAERAYHQRALQILEQLEGEVSSFHLNFCVSFVLLLNLQFFHGFHLFLSKL